MKKAKLIVTIIVLAAIFGVAGWLLVQDYRKGWHRHDAEIGQKVFAGLVVNDVAAIRIRDKDNVVDLQRKDDRWVVMQQHEYPADFETMSELVLKLPELKAIQTFIIPPKDRGPLLLLNPTEAGATGSGVSLELFAANGKLLTSTVLGKSHKDANPHPILGRYFNGRYLIVPGSGAVVLVKETFDAVTPDSTDWLAKTFPRVRTFRRASSFDGEEGLWVISSTSDGKGLVLHGTVPNGTSVDMDKLGRVREVMSFLNYSAIGPPNTPREQWGFGNRRFVAEDASGVEYTFTLGKKTEDGDLPVKVDVGFHEPALGQGPANELPQARAKREAKHFETVATSRKQADMEKAFYAGWVYILPRASHEPMLMERSDLLKGTAKGTPDPGDVPMPDDPPPAKKDEDVEMDPE